MTDPEARDFRKSGSALSSSIRASACCGLMLTPAPPGAAGAWLPVGGAPVLCVSVPWVPVVAASPAGATLLFSSAMVYAPLSVVPVLRRVAGRVLVFALGSRWVLE